MIDDIRAGMLAYRQECLSDLLSRWDNWLHPVQVSRGHASQAAGCALYRSSRQYDDENGALDDQVEHQVMQGVQGCVEKLEPLHRYAIHDEAKRLRLGVSVWSNPRLPADPADRQKVTDAARLCMIGHLCGSGLME